MYSAKRRNEMKTKHRNDYTNLHGLYKHILILAYSSGDSTVRHILCVTRNTNEAASLWTVNGGGGYLLVLVVVK